MLHGMEHRQLGTSGPQLSVVGLGCNNFGMRIDAAATDAVVHAALDAGITHFDTAEMYGGGKSEEFLGAALGSRRDEVVIATKYLPRPGDQPYTPGILATRIREAAEGSLRRLGTDRIDLYYQHYPDADAPIDEALEALDELVRSGKVLHIASSNVTAPQIAEAATVSTSHSWAAFSGTQIEWSLLARDVEESIVPAAEAAGLGVVPYFPLASGMLTGKYRRGEDFPEGTRLASSPYFAKWATDENFAKVDGYAAFAARSGHSVTELAIAWLLAQPSVTSVIAGATRPEQIAANVAAATRNLSAAEAAEVANIQ
ncbi:MAG: aldo/keto reductase [Acidimicrobiales bacterium]|nr:aldo/keto reductase [Acidimicrobiales bacterium]